MRSRQVEGAYMGYGGYGVYPTVEKGVSKGYEVGGVAVRVAVGVAVLVGGVPVIVGVAVGVIVGVMVRVIGVGTVGVCVTASAMDLPASFKRAMLVKGLLE